MQKLKKFKSNIDSSALATIKGGVDSTADKTREKEISYSVTGEKLDKCIYTDTNQ